MNSKLKKTAVSIISIFFLGGLIIGCSSSDTVQDKKKVEAIVAAMTLKEKAQLVIGTGMFHQLPDSIIERYGDKRMADPNDSAYSAMVRHIQRFVPGAAGNSSMFEEKGISTMVLTDGPAGLRIQPKRRGEDRTYYCTAFPIATVLASTWDKELVEQVGKAMGNEVLEYGSDILLAPALNIQRDPLCGRNFEYYSEDPLIAGKMAAAMVKGIQSNGVGTSIKHFVANNQETNRMSVNTIVSERALRELYLKGFEIAVKEAQPWTVMSSYNKLNGTYTSESHDLLTKILRDDWGFEGYVMTDWGGGSDVVEQMKAGNDMIQPGNSKQIARIIEAVNNGELDETTLNKNVSRILTVMLKTPKYKGFEYSNNPNLESNAKITRQAAAEGMVLLENNGALPFSSTIKKVAAFGNTSYDFISGGTGSGDVNEAYTISLIQGLENGDYTISSDLMKVYDEYIKETRNKTIENKNIPAFMRGRMPVEEMPVSKELAAQIAGNNDIGLITIGRNSGEGRDRKPIPGDFYLTETEQEMIENVSEAFHAAGKKVVVVLNIGGAIETYSWKQKPDAVLLAWQPGQEAGNSVVDVLSGKVNPSGKLAISFPVKYEDGPAAKNFPGQAVQGETGNEADQSGFSQMRRKPWEVVYEEDIYVGYRYYTTFNVAVSYPFGYGLSYTTFEYSPLKLSASNFNKKINVVVKVKNSGSAAGRNVVEIYLSKPNGKLKKPIEELVDFDKTKLLNPGESTTLEFEIEPADLCSFDEASSSWLAEHGEYIVKLGASSTDIQASASFNLANDLNIETVSKALTPMVNIDRLSK